MRYSAKEMQKSPEGRKRLAKIREAHKFDILQPGDFMFDKVYGKKIKERNERLEKDKRNADERWLHHQEVKEYNKKYGRK